jgi:SAM-dependent methyltransferase
MPVATYDEIADWYEENVGTRPDDPLELGQLLRELLGPGRGTCLEIGCGTGMHAGRVRALGWNAVGVDLSAGMLRHGAPRLPAGRADASRLPIRDASVPAVLSAMAHTDMPAYGEVLREAVRVLAPGGVLVHIGVHPCFCGGFANRRDESAVVIKPGYLDGHWTMDSWTDQGLRDKVGAAHWPLPQLLDMFTAAGLTLERFAEGGHPTPTVLGVRAVKAVRG